MLLFESLITNYSTLTLIDFIFSTFLVIILNLFIYYFVRRKIAIGIIIGLSSLFVVFSLFGMNVACYVTFGILLILSLFILIVNMAEVRSIFVNIGKQKRASIFAKKNQRVEKIFDHDSLYKTINETVLYLSKNKIGALITFERKDQLKSIMKNGSYLYAPVTYELLITIFYPGTRLHDGAVVIKGDTIIAASVYYTPTTKPLTGKYGSRHRAAIGISEVSDAVTVVVSEETGRISIAYNGNLESYAPDNFYKAFENIMAETDTNE